MYKPYRIVINQKKRGKSVTNDAFIGDKEYALQYARKIHSEQNVPVAVYAHDGSLVVEYTILPPKSE